MLTEYKMELFCRRKDEIWQVYGNMVTGALMTSDGSRRL
jgi:hypothetical protein